MLEGLLVLDLSRVLAGPYCTQLLADLGARVVKIESPHGDDTRGWGPPFAGDQSGYFLSVNRGKESVAVDLKRPEGAELVRRLAEQADVLVENFKVGDLKRYGLDPASVAERNPRLVYASITGYGSRGPRAREPGYDAALQAITGLVAMTGEEGGPPVKLGVAWIDVLTGLHAAVAILAALQERQTTGRGRHLELSLYEVGLASMVNQAQNALLTGRPPARLGSAHPSIVPYQVFDTADDPIMLAVGNDAQFARAAKVLGAPEWGDDPRFATNEGRVRNRDALVPAVQQRLRAEPRDAWLRRFAEAQVSATPVLGLPEALDDAQARALDTVGRYRHPSAGEVAFVRSPLRHAGPLEPDGPGADEEATSEIPHARSERPPPRLGADARKVLADVLQAGDADVEGWLRDGILVEDAHG